MAWRQRTAVAIATAGIVLSSPATAQQRVVLTGATLIDGTGRAPLPDARLVIENGRFTCVGGARDCAARPGDRDITLAGRWITPGLIDTHVHLDLVKSPEVVAREQRLRFALGITTVRDADSEVVLETLAERERARDSTRAVPRVEVAARVTQAYADRLGVEFGAPLVAKLAQLGVGAIKIKGVKRWREDVAAARMAGIPAYGHTWGGPAPSDFLRDAMVEGMSGVTHLMSFARESQPPGTDMTPPESADDVWRWHKNLWVSARSVVLDSLIDMMIARDLWLEPTLSYEYYWGRATNRPAALRFLGRPPGIREVLGLGGAPRIEAAYPASFARQAAFVGEFVRRGGTIVAGTDDYDAGVDLHEEMRMIAEAAGTPMAGLLSATRNAARAINRADLGTIEPGKVADAVVFAADPLATPGSTLAITTVIKGGVLHDAAALTAGFRAEYAATERAVWRRRAIMAGGTLAAALAGLLLLRAVVRRTRRSP